VGQEDDAHGETLKRDALRIERDRVDAQWAAYRGDPRKARAWSAENAGNQAIRAELVAQLRHTLGRRLAPGGGEILDVGCGTGWWLAELAAGGVDATRLRGVEALADRVAAARGRVPGATIELGDARALPLPDGAVSAVTLLTVLSSLADSTDVACALREARRVVAPGGIVVVWEPRIATPGNRATLLVRRRQVEAVLGATEIRTLTVLPPLARRTARIYPWLARVPLLRTHRVYSRAFE
jgi:SAM-dependent methyltransferase